MDFDKYQQQAMTFCTPESNNPTYMLLGLNEEVGELTGKFAKAVRKGILKPDLSPNVGEPNDELMKFYENFEKEIGDVMWMVAGLHNVLNKRMETSARLNIKKLTDRKKRGVIVGEGDNR